MFEGLPSGSAKRHVANGLRVLFSFLEAQGWPEDYFNVLRKNPSSGHEFIKKVDDVGY